MLVSRFLMDLQAIRARSLAAQDPDGAGDIPLGATSYETGTGTLLTTNFTFDPNAGPALGTGAPCTCGCTDANASLGGRDGGKGKARAGADGTTPTDTGETFSGASASASASGSGLGSGLGSMGGSRETATVTCVTGSWASAGAVLEPRPSSLHADDSGV